VDIKDQVGVASVWVGNCGKRSGGTTRNKGFGRSGVVTRKENHLFSGTGITDGGKAALGFGVVHLVQAINERLHYLNCFRL